MQECSCRCANQYAKPILMCRKCVGHFLNVRTYYHALEHSETDGMNCKSILTSQDTELQNVNF